MVKILQGDCREVLKTLPDGSVNCCVTSPPYFGLRDYGVDGQIGLEQTPDAYVAELVSVFREVKRTLRDDGVLFLNIGDSYASFRDGKATPDTTRGESVGTLVPKGQAKNRTARTFSGTSIKHKDLIGIPWMVAFALRADGWYLRQDIIWSKPNPMPESVRDRCTKSHEYVFLLSKSPRYYFDHEAIKEASVTGDPRRPYGSKGAWDLDGRPLGQRPQGRVRKSVKRGEFNGKTNALLGREAFRAVTETRNKRSVWTVATQPFSGAKLMADYVGVDGKPYTASPDCPIHGPMLRSGMFDKAANDGRTKVLKNRNPDSGPDLFSWREPSPAAKTFRSRSEVEPASAHEQTLGSTDVNRSGDHLIERTSGEKNLLRNGSTSTTHADLGHRTGCGCHECSVTATDRSSGTSKTDRARQTSQRDTVSEETPTRTPSTVDEPSLVDSAVHTSASSTEPDATDDHPLGENSDRNADISLSSCNPECHICERVSIDHFATFPPDLIKPCILAGCPVGGTVLDPFGGSGTTGEVAEALGRNSILIELNPAYIELQKQRTAQMGLGL